jgi:hypothetical protein
MEKKSADFREFSDAMRAYRGSLFFSAVSGLAFQFYIPVKVIAPGLGSCPESNRNVKHGGHPFGLLRVANQPHAGFFWSASSFFVIALDAAGDDIFPGLCPALDHGNDMVKGEVLSRAFFPTVLASVVVSGIDVCPTELYMLEALSGLYIFKQSEDAGHLNGEADAPDLSVVLGQHLDFALK